LRTGKNLRGFIESFLAALRTRLMYNIQGLPVNTKTRTIVFPEQKSDQLLLNLQQVLTGPNFCHKKIDHNHAIEIAYSCTRCIEPD